MYYYGIIVLEALLMLPTKAQPTKTTAMGGCFSLAPAKHHKGPNMNMPFKTFLSICLFSPQSPRRINYTVSKTQARGHYQNQGIA